MDTLGTFCIVYNNDTIHTNDIYNITEILNMFVRQGLNVLGRDERSVILFK